MRVETRMGETVGGMKRAERRRLETIGTGNMGGLCSSGDDVGTSEMGATNGIVGRTTGCSMEVAVGEEFCRGASGTSSRGLDSTWSGDVVTDGKKG